MGKSTLRDRMANEAPENFYMDGEARFGHCPKCLRRFTSRTDCQRHNEDVCGQRGQGPTQQAVDVAVAQVKAELESPAFAQALTGVAQKVEQVYTVGKIVEHSWGYDQTNIDFWQIVKRTATFVTLRRVVSQQVETPDAPWMTGRSIPCAEFMPNVEPVRRKVIVGQDPRNLGRGTEIGVGSPNGCGWAELWNGKPANWSSYA